MAVANEQQVLDFIREYYELLNGLSFNDFVGKLYDFTRPDFILRPSNCDMTKEVPKWQERVFYVQFEEDGVTVIEDGQWKYLTLRVASHWMEYVTSVEGDHAALRKKFGAVDYNWCAACSRVHPITPIPDDLPEQWHGDWLVLCSRCLRGIIGQCVECGEWVMNDEIYLSNDGGDTRCYCLACYTRAHTRCKKCCKYVLNDDIQVFEFNGIKEDLCELCYSRMWKKCIHCHDDFTTMFRNYGQANELRYCDKCLHEVAAFHSHMYKPMHNHFHLAKGEIRQTATMFYGIELECELGDEGCRVTFAKNLKAEFPLEVLYMVHDGSMDYGIEAVLQPISDSWYMTKRDKLKDIYETMERLGGDFDSPKVGLHIHTSKAAWSPTQIYKLVRFLYEGAHQPKLQKFYGRAPVFHSTLQDSEYRGAVLVAKEGKNVDDSNHYNQINLSCGNTIEFRMFAGTESFDDLCRYIDFIRSLFTFTNASSISEMSLKYYSQFLADQGNQYRRVLPYFKGDK